MLIISPLNIKQKPFDMIIDCQSCYICHYPVQRNPSCEAISFVPEMQPFKRGGLLSGVEINTCTVCVDLQCQLAFPEGMSSGQGGLSKGVPMDRANNTLSKRIKRPFPKLC